MKLRTRILTVFNMITPNSPPINRVFTTDDSFFVRVPFSEKREETYRDLSRFRAFLFPNLVFRSKKDCSLLVHNLT